MSAFRPELPLADALSPRLPDNKSDRTSLLVLCSEFCSFDWTVGAKEACVDPNLKLGTHFMVELLTDTRRLKLEDQINQLDELSRIELVEVWFKQFKYRPPKGVKRGLLERAAGYRLQAKRRGGLRADTRKALLTIAAGKNPELDALPKQKMATGSRLIREWHGQTHYVDVTDDGFEWNEERYSSLSAIALAITGTKWSGPRFFGVAS
ncbi:MAG: DUF2924 domain-containing protein [Pseudomonadota bacterium]